MAETAVTGPIRPIIVSASVRCVRRWPSCVPALRSSWRSGTAHRSSGWTWPRRTLVATGRAERLLDGLLALARSDGGALGSEPHDLALAAACALAEADAEVGGAGLTIRTNLCPAPVGGDPGLLDRLVSNLVDNAIRHNESGAWVEVSTGRRGATAVVTVRNGGDEIPAAQVDRLCEPFQRLTVNPVPGARSTGLGRAIVRSIGRARRHGDGHTEPPGRGDRHRGPVRPAPTSY
ncbi:HAMP domain-containing sensor histidine kinase [Micromonospora chersina]|uniref:sensor histidine kinase n=1 Tax=Micromonospora chersina TaxID=47854 RepID=UPI0033CB25DF